MNKDERHQRSLERAYLATDYIVHGAESFVIRIGKTCEKLDPLLQMHEVETWAFLTACNPDSKILPESDNIERMRELEQEIRTAGFASLPGEGRIGDSSWPPERSLLIFGIDEDEALILARRFGQLAFVCGVRSEKARLVWTDGR